MRQPVQQRSISKRRELVAAAARVFAEKGYYRTTIEEITTLAGVGRGAFYHYFNKGKSDVATAVVTEGFTMDAAVPTLPRIQSVVDASIALATLTPVVPVVKAAARLATEQDHPDSSRCSKRPRTRWADRWPVRSQRSGSHGGGIWWTTSVGSCGRCRYRRPSPCSRHCGMRRRPGRRRRFTSMRRSTPST
ncbi:TetR family transcriptional regulator [Streptomyces sp. NPDC058011]|uniref:TetR family transcriptional regulator n=1 Tax=Streptomyces sp. NPDC058011 TaxID=3346305 RepID=UPI0036EC31B5